MKNVIKKIRSNSPAIVYLRLIVFVLIGLILGVTISAGFIEKVNDDDILYSYASGYLTTDNIYFNIDTVEHIDYVIKETSNMTGDSFALNNISTFSEVYDYLCKHEDITRKLMTQNNSFLVYLSENNTNLDSMYFFMNQISSNLEMDIFAGSLFISFVLTILFYRILTLDRKGLYYLTIPTYAYVAYYNISNGFGVYRLFSFWDTLNPLESSNSLIFILQPLLEALLLYIIIDVVFELWKDLSRNLCKFI